jgi:hypothetical protein
LGSIATLRPSRRSDTASRRRAALSVLPRSISELYGKRTQMIEPVFADTKFNRRIDRCQRRGRAACRSDGA